jgi:hypothetical protein
MVRLTVVDCSGVWWAKRQRSLFIGKAKAARGRGDKLTQK